MATRTDPRDPGATPSSSALRANLEVTRRDVEIPPEYRVLLEAVAPYWGVRRSAEKLLTEFFHPYRNLDEVTVQLRNLCGGMFHYLERAPERAECVDLLTRLLGELYHSRPALEAMRAVVGVHLELVTHLVDSPFRPEMERALDGTLAALDGAAGSDVDAFLPYSGLMSRFGSRLPPDDPAGDAFAAIYRRVVERGLEVFEGTIDLERWCRRQADGAACRTGVAKPVAAAVVEARTALEDGAATIYGAANLDDLLTLTLARTAELTSSVERIALYVYLAGVAELGHRSMEILRTLYYSIKTACDEGSEADVIRSVDLVTEHLRDCDPTTRFLLYKCLEKLGEGIAARAHHAVTAHLVDRVIATGFEAPDVSGVSDEWEVFVNPNHLPCLRAWLATIEADPIQYEALLSALVINLHLHGVFVADTDLFQRDISALLNADIAGAFNLILQLVGFFPVFFNEVGSEGELRDVSTRIDQLRHRQDPVIHYLRKQSHAESNNRLVGFARAVWAWWRSGDATVLGDYLPPTIVVGLDPEADWFTGPHGIVCELQRRHGLTEDDLGRLDQAELERHLDALQDLPEVDRERVALLARLERLLRAKYTLSWQPLLAMLDGSPLVPAEVRTAFAAACADGDHLTVVTAGNRLLAELKRIITDTAVTEAEENIFHKRHIAAGIPSMYGTYKEPKFDAMGLMIRTIGFLKPHLEALVAGFNFRVITRESVREAQAVLEQMLAGLVVSGLRVHHLSTKLDLLGRAIAFGSLSVEQYLNVFDFMSEALSDVVETNYIALHNPNLERMAAQLKARRPGDDPQAVDRASEELLRSLIASTYAIQEMDLFLRRIRRTLRRMTGNLSERACAAVLHYSPARLVSFLHDPVVAHEDQLSMGYKGYSLKRLAELGLPVPPGFVISTELFNLKQALDDPDVAADTRERVIDAVRRLERVTGRGFGEPERPLVVSVRSGSAFSMPGMMLTVLNVGISPAIVEAMTRAGHPPWGAWDSYRRYLQNVAMAHGVSRDLFDDVMLRAKERHGVERKSSFTAEQMREMTEEYRLIGEEHRVVFPDDPIDQLLQAIRLVLDSWHSEPARLFRNQLGHSDDWGTGVIVQEMKFGNLGDGSGSGVTFTRNPRSSTTGIGLFGDFTLRSQGEDVVGGLVRPYPVSEKQRREYSPHLEMSLEQAFPEIYRRLGEVASLLIHEHGYEHQEIEFTFESPEFDGLHLLQVRPMRLLRQRDLRVFARPDALREHLLGTGIGVSGGAMVGRVAFTDEDVCSLREAHPAESVILLRPDTVPEDIHLVVAVDGLLTARGGFTSHAAVTAKRLGKCCVVNCSGLEVSESQRSARIGGRTLKPGDLLSIDGFLGPVYLGGHDIVASAVPHRLS